MTLLFCLKIFRRHTAAERRRRESFYLGHVRNQIDEGYNLENKPYLAWARFCSTFADKFLDYARNRNTPIEKLQTVYQTIGVKRPKADGTALIAVIDSFTILGLFNKGAADADRIAILHGIAKEFFIAHTLSAAIDGIPMLDVSAPQIPCGAWLPTMRSDITLTDKCNVLIIDAEHYARVAQAQYDVHTLRFGNLHQFFTYDKNKDSEFAETPCKISGMLLYAKTGKSVQPNSRCQMSGDAIGAKTLDLYLNFARIAKRLNAVMKRHFRMAA